MTLWSGRGSHVTASVTERTGSHLVRSSAIQTLVSVETRFPLLDLPGPLNSHGHAIVKKATALMNKTSLFLASLLSLGRFGCAAPSEAPPAAEPTPEVEAEVEPTSEEIAAHGIAALTDALTRVDWQTLSDKADEE